MKPARLIAARLSKEGFGTPVEILRMPADVVMEAVHYSNFLNDYERTYSQLNKENTP